MDIINLTPHPVHIRDEHGTIITTLPVSGRAARLEETSEPDGTVQCDGHDVPVELKAYGGIEGLPAAPDGITLYVVPLLTALAAKAAGRDVSDLLVPGVQTRDASGTVNGCRSLGRLA